MEYKWNYLILWCTVDGLTPKISAISVTLKLSPKKYSSRSRGISYLGLPTRRLCLLFSWNKVTLNMLSFCVLVLSLWGWILVSASRNLCNIGSFNPFDYKLKEYLTYITLKNFSRENSRFEIGEVDLKIGISFGEIASCHSKVTYIFYFTTILNINNIYLHFWQQTSILFLLIQYNSFHTAEIEIQWFSTEYCWINCISIWRVLHLCERLQCSSTYMYMYDMVKGKFTKM